MSTLKAAKTALREEVSKVLKKLDNNEKKRQSMSVLKKFLALPQYKASQRISVYLSTEDEIDTLPFLQHFFTEGKEVFVPRYHGKEMNMVKLYSMEDYNELPLTKWSIKQPSIKEIREDASETGGLDLIILPGMAFTKSGKRLGHGMGYYDKYLSSITLDKKRMPYLTAVAFNEQIYEDIPTNEQDFLLDFVLTENDNSN